MRQKEVELMSHRAENDKEYSKEIMRIKAQMSKPEGYFFKVVCNWNAKCYLGDSGTKLAKFAAEFNKVELSIKTQLESLKKMLNDIC